MIDTDDSDFDIPEESDIPISDKLDRDMLAAKKDVRAEIEKKLELLALRKSTKDFYDDITFN